MDRTLHLTAFETASALRFRIVCAEQLLYASVFIFYDFIACYKVCALESHLIAREQSEIFLYRDFHEIVPVNVEFSAERNSSVAHFRDFPVVFDFHFFGLIFRIVRYHYFYRIFDYIPVFDLLLEVFSHAVFEQADIHCTVCFGHAYPLAEITYGLRRVTSSSYACNGRHSGIVPSVNCTVIHHRLEISLAHHSIS